jgi:Protein of unknown function (DUF3987)
LSTAVENLVHRLDAKKSGASWIAKCPGHKDRTPSLSISEGADGRALLKCHAGCGLEDILTAAGLTKADLFPEKPVRRQRRNGPVLNPGCAVTPSPSPSTAKDFVQSSNEVDFCWEQCVDAVEDKSLERLSGLRGYSPRFCQWLKENRLVGILDSHFVFPVHDNGKVVGAHVRQKNGWRYTPTGTKTRPLVIGELHNGGTVHVFESQWDAFAFMDVSDQKSSIVITRGASNGRLVAGVIPERAKVYVWPQNDSAGEKWQRDICANTDAAVKRTDIPAPHKDLNEWTLNGGTADDLLAAIVNAETIRAVDAFEGFETGQELENENKDPFPLSSLPPLVEAMAKEVCATERVPESLAGCCALGILSASIGAGLEIQSAANRVTRGNVYVLASAESGSGKSETFRHMAKPFQQFEIERVNAWREQDRADIVARRTLVEVDIKELKKKYARRCGDISAELKAYELEVEELEKRLHAPILSCEDVTSEKLAILLSENDEQLASLSADALSIVNILLGHYNRLDRTDEGLYLKAYSGDPCRIDRMSRDPVSLESPCLTALWLTQPDKLEALLDERSLNEGGLIPRILPCHTNCEPREIGRNPPAISMSTSKAYAGLIYSLLSTYRLAHERFALQPTPEALQELNDHHDAIVKRRRGELRDVTSYAARWNEQAWRISVCLHAATHGAEAHQHLLDLETAQHAITLADWFAEQQLRILNAGRTQRKVERLQKLRELIVQQYNGEATLRDLKLRNGFKADEVRELVMKFPGMLAIEKRETGGRPSEIVSLPKK